MQYIFANLLPRASFAKIAVGIRVEHSASKLSILLCECAFKIVLTPKVELALLTFAVGVYCRIERTFRRCHLPSDKRKDFACDACINVFPSSLIRLDICEPEERLVVQHLLEMGHQPPSVGRIAVKAKSYVVINTAQPHRLKRAFDHLQRSTIAGTVPVPQEKRQVVRRRKLRRSPESAVPFVKDACDIFIRELNRQRGNFRRR